MSKLKAKRIKGFSEIETDKICYFKSKETGHWMLYHPDSGLGDLDNHDVTEHEDGTISVKPSILISTKNRGENVSVHGYLKSGVWVKV